MSRLSTARKIGLVARVAGRQVARTRHFGALANAGRATAVHLKRVLGQLWLEVTGFVFLCFAVIFGLAGVREYARYTSGQATSGRVGMAVAACVLFGWFGLSSFWRVRKMSWK